MDFNIKLRIIKNRARALYHNCHSAACFIRSDADLSENETEKAALLREAQAYESAAGWIKGLIDSI